METVQINNVYYNTTATADSTATTADVLGTDASRFCLSPSRSSDERNLSSLHVSLQSEDSYPSHYLWPPGHTVSQ